MLILASSSRYRRELLARAGIEVTSMAPDVDERAFDHLLGTEGPCGLAVAIATAKAHSVAAITRSVPGRAAPAMLSLEQNRWILAADQLAVVEGPDGRPAMLTKPGTPERAVEQLLSMSGSTHELVNGVVVLHDGAVHRACDVHRVTMRAFTRREAEDYVAEFAPLDCVGSYRIEDDADLIESVEGSGDDGVIGLPLDVVRALLAEAGWPDPASVA